MNVRLNGKIICCILAIIVLFLGIGAEISAADSSFLRTENVTSASTPTIRATESVVDDAPVCTLGMLQNGMRLIRNNIVSNMGRWQDRMVVIFSIAAGLLQFLFYQSTEAKEDGQLFLCRSVIVNYIHQKDNGK